MRQDSALTIVRNSANIKKVPQTEVVFFEEDDGTVPLLDWLGKLPVKARDKCLARLVRLEQLGHDLRRPEADYLEAGIYELRATHRGVHYRMLYFFSDRACVVVSHGIVKERRVSAREIGRATERHRRFEADPEGHTFRPRADA